MNCDGKARWSELYLQKCPEEQACKGKAYCIHPILAQRCEKK